MPHDELLKYFIEETNKKFDGVSEKLDGVHQKLEDLGKFKIEMLVSSRWIALIVSSVVGVITLVATLTVTFYAGRDISVVAAEKPALTIKDMSNEPHTNHKH
jgi:hypothetical protein